MSEIRNFALGAAIASGIVFSGCVSERDTNFTWCNELDSSPQSTGDSPIYLRENRLGTNYKLTLGENKFLRNPNSGELEWIVKDIPQEMFPQDEIVVFDNTTDRTADIHFKHRESFIRADIATECNSNKPLTPIKTY